MINSMMEGTFKDIANNDTADSDYFYKRNLHSQLQTPRLIDFSDSSIPSQLEEQLSRLKQALFTNSEWIQKLKSKEDLKVYRDQTLQELLIQQGKSQAELELSKLNFQKGMGQLERKLACYHNQWKELKQKKQVQVQQAIDDFKTSKKQNQTYIANLFKDTGTQIRNKLSNFTKQIKTIRKTRVQKKNQLMQSVEHLRGTLDQKVEAERKNRADYESIVLTLLDKTCSQGEHLLRRICI